MRYGLRFLCDFCFKAVDIAYGNGGTRHICQVCIVDANKEFAQLYRRKKCKLAVEVMREVAG